MVYSIYTSCWRVISFPIFLKYEFQRSHPNSDWKLEILKLMSIHKWTTKFIYFELTFLIQKDFRNFFYTLLKFTSQFPFSWISSWEIIWGLNPIPGNRNWSFKVNIDLNLIILIITTAKLGITTFIKNFVNCLVLTWV